MPPTGLCAGAGDITCVIGPGEAGQGSSCDSGILKVPSGVCADGDTIQRAKFKVEYCTCAESDNTQTGACSDEGPLPIGEAVRMTCSDPQDNLIYSQNVVEGDEVVMNAGAGGLPDQVTCSVFSTAGALLQTFVVNPSGSENLFLTDKFGSLSLLACDDQDCSATVVYTYEICSSGTIDLLVTVAESDLNGAITDLIPEFSDTTIVPNVCETAQETKVINLCEDDCFINTFTMNDSTELCGDASLSEFCVFPEPTPAPTPPPTAEPTQNCIIPLTIECPDCFKNGTTVEPCDQRPINLTMLYAGRGCERAEGENCQDADKYQCEDSNGGPPVAQFNSGVSSWILATSDDGGDIYFEGEVEVGQPYAMVNGGERFPADQMIRIYEDSSKSTLLQTVLYHSSCSQNLDLLNSFGSNTIIEWCDEDKCIDGFDNQDFQVTLDIPISAGYEGDGAVITSLLVAQTATSELEGEVAAKFFNLTDAAAGVVLEAGTTVQVNASVPINLLIERDYAFLITMTAETDDGLVCQGFELVNFTAGGANIGPDGGGTCAVIAGGEGGGDDKNNDKNNKNQRERGLLGKVKNAVRGSRYSAAVSKSGLTGV